MARFLTRGHPAAAAAIQAMIVGSAPHAIVIAGPAGVGKMTLALDLAAGLLCDAPEPADRPCRECRGCHLVERGIHADLHRLAPSGPGLQVRIGSHSAPEPGTVRRLISDLALLPVEGGARVALVERADRLNEDAQSALLKTLEEPPAGVTIVLCADREDQLLPTVLSRCIRLRLGPVAIREIEGILVDAGIADAPTAARLARLSGGRPGIARTWALAPDAVTARSEIARSLLDLAGERAARRLSVGRELLGRAGDLVHALDRATKPPVGDAPPKRGRKAGSAVVPARVAASAADSEDVAQDRGDEATDDADETDSDAPAERGVRASATERRRAAGTLVEIWRDLSRDLILVSLGEERRLRDPEMLEDLRAASDLTADQIGPFLVRLDRTGELLEANVSPELAIDVLLLAWPRRNRAA
jgi:DNA polymerase III delta subunit-like protein